MKEHFNKKTDTRSKVKIQRIHADISGIRPESFRGYKYFMLYIDDDTRMCWVYLMKTKTSEESISVFKSFGIQLKASPPYKHSINGVVERAMQTINKIA